MTDLYAQDNFILRHHEIGAGIAELELKFPVADRQKALVYSLALVYLALYRRGIPFVAHDATLKRFALRTADLDDATRHAFIDAIAIVRRNVTQLLSCAEFDLFERTDPGVLETDPQGQLAAYRQAEVTGKRFLEQFALALGERPAAPY